MSTKTTLKRIALVAVSALGFGVLTSVAPVSADGAVEPSLITPGTIRTTQVGVTNLNDVVVTYPGTADGSDTFVVAVTVTSAPSGSAYNQRAAVTRNAANDGAGSFVTGAYASSGSTSFAAQITIEKPSAATTGIVGDEAVAGDDSNTVTSIFTSAPGTLSGSNRTQTFRVGIVPDVAGSYTVLVSTSNATAATNAKYLASEGDASATYTFTTGNTVSTVTLAAVGPAAPAGDGTNGRLFKATIADSAGAVTSLASNQSITLSSSLTTTEMGVVSQTAGTYTLGTAGANLVLGQSDFTNGVAYFMVGDATATATTATITATGTGTLASSVSSTVTNTTVATTTLSSTTLTITDPTGATRPGSGRTAVSADAATASTAATSHTYQVNSTDTADGIYKLTVTDTSGKITGIPGLVYTTTVATTYSSTAATNTGSFTITATLANGNSFNVVADGTTDDTLTVTGATPAANATQTTVSPSVDVKAAVGGSVTFTITVRDQFAAAMSAQSITVTRAGRNATTTSTSLATDANGRATYTYTDAGTAATAATTDTITWVAPGGNETSTVTWGTYAVKTVTLVTGTEDDTATSITYRDIDASSLAGTQAGAASITATVKDANGAVMVGIPVTFSTASQGAAVRTTSATVYTDSAGKAAASVYGWTAGTKTFTATAGGVSGTGTVNYRQGGSSLTAGAAEVRTISAALSGNAITVTAKDRFGNNVPGVALFATRTGNGLFGGGTNTASGTTDATGTLEFIFNAGSADSVVTIYAGTSANDPGYGQTSAKAGERCVGTDCTGAAWTASVAGDAFTGETGVGATLAPAGVNNVKVNVAAATNAAATAAEAASDAALEAIDAANAATDAANLAAEAADAATVAAEEARDAADAATAAVEALASEVATLIAGLKAQITTLANTVAKIAKKIRA